MTWKPRSFANGLLRQQSKNELCETVMPLLDDMDQTDVQFQPEESKSNITILSKIKKWIYIANVYPVLFFTSCSYGLFFTIQMPFFYWSRCVELEADLNNTDELCRNLSGPVEHELQLDIATLHLNMRLASCIPALVISPLFGAWSDGTGGRKKPLIITLFLSLISQAVIIICTVTYRVMSIYFWVLLSYFIFGLAGDTTVQHAAMYSMVTDDARGTEHQSKRITFLVSIGVGITSLSHVFGNSLSSIITLRKTAGAYFIGITLSVILYAVGFVYAVFLVHDTYREEGETEAQNEENTTENKIYTKFKSMKSIFVARITEVTDTLRRPRIGWTRLCLNLTVASAFVEMLALDNGLLFLFVKKSPFNWSDHDFSLYIAVLGFVRTAGTVFWPIFFTKLTTFRGPDMLMVIYGLAALIVYFFLLGISSKNWMIIVAGGVSFFFGMVGPGFRSFIPKLVQQNETGRVYTCFGMVSLLAPILSSLLFNNIYKATLDVFAGFAFLVAAGMQVFVLAAMILVHVLMLKTARLVTSNDDSEILVESSDDESSAPI